MNEDWSKLQDIFDEAWPLDPDARQSLLAARCQGDEGLRAEVERMLRAFDAESQATVKPERPFSGVRFGVWETVKLLGRGGMGEVFLARRVDGQIEQRAALKVMSRSLATTEYVERFRRERQLLARLEHSNIARLLDGGVNSDGSPYMVMEYVEGEPLDRYCTDRKLSIRERVLLVRSLCMAVDSAHRNLILHRDIKPSNVLVTADGVVKLLDFGAARELDAGTLETRAPLTPAYASPEQLSGGPVTTLSDVYGLGATLYRLLAGVAPFGSGGNISTLVRSVLEDEPPAPSATADLTPPERRDLQGDLDNIVRKAMEKDPARRYASAERLAADLGRWLDRRPIEARPRTWRYRAERFASRNRWGVMLAAALLLTLVAAVAAIGWQVRQEHETARYNARLTEFLTRVMGLRYDAESSPMRAHGRGTRMIDVIRYAADRLNTEMSDQPALQARLDADIGHALAELGYFDAAERSLRRGIALTDSQKDPALAGELLGYLARNHFLQGSVRDSDKEFTEALRLVRASGSSAPKVVEQLLLLNLAPARELRQGLTPEVESMTQRAVDLGLQIGEASPAYALSLQARADVWLTHGKIADAEADLQHSLAIQEHMSEVPLEHAQSLAEMALIQATKGNLDEVGRLLDRARPVYEEALGPASMSCLIVRYSHGKLLALRQDFKGAAKELAEVDQDVARDLPQAKWLRNRVLCGLASSLAKLGRKDEARTALEQALALAQDDPGPDSPMAHQTQQLLNRP
jgi:serine/threonine-protein kinase